MLEEDIYKVNSETYGRTGDVSNLTADSAGGVVFR